MHLLFPLHLHDDGSGLRFNDDPGLNLHLLIRDWSLPLSVVDQLVVYFSPGLEVIKLLSCSTQLSTKLIIFINVKMPTIVGILTFISMINKTTKGLKAIQAITFWHFSLYEQLNFHVQLSLIQRKFYNLRGQTVPFLYFTTVSWFNSISVMIQREY